MANSSSAREPKEASFRMVELVHMAERLENVPPSEILRLAVEAYGKDLTLSVSFGNPEGMVLLDMLSRITDRVQVFTLDTGFLFEETVRFREEVIKKYPLPLKIITPGLSVEEQVERYGPELYSCKPDLCCQIRKIEPQRRFLRDYGAWITGIRRNQTPQRAHTPVVGWEPRFEVVKIVPLATWSSEQVEEYIREHDVPTNPLLNKGYLSIGCEPCTQPVEDREDARAGRWRGLGKTECGLHFEDRVRAALVGEDLKRGEVETKKHSRALTARVGAAHRTPLANDSKVGHLGEDMEQWPDKSVLITGVCGTVGQELLKQVVKRGPSEIIGLDNNESELFFLMREYRAQTNVRFFLGDLRDRDEMVRKVRGVDIVLHTAALKHVILCEESPRDAVQTNILGTQNLIDAALATVVERLLLTSSDKAVNPTSVMGTSKLMAERLMTAANAVRRGDKPIFSVARFGNILGSRGSVIPIFKRQIAQGGPVTLTDPSMTRFIMTLEEAVRLVVDSVFLANGGEVFVTKMPVIRIRDLATVMIEELAPHYGLKPDHIEVEVIGSKAGEKLYEELINEEEARRTVGLERYFVVTPAFESVYQDIEYAYPGMSEAGVHFAYNSSIEEPMSPDELRSYLLRNRLLEVESEHALTDLRR